MTRAKQLSPVAAPLVRVMGDLIAPRARGTGRLCIINYHRILRAPDPLLDSEPTVEDFHWQMDVLSKCFNVLPLHEALARLAGERMPPRAVAITFDDGYRSTHDIALPILKQHGLPATVFVTTGHMGDASSMWNDIILEAVRRLPPAPLDLGALGLGVHPMQHPHERKATAAHLTERCKYMAPADRQRMTGALQALAGADLAQELMLTADMIRALSQNGVEIGGHTVTHPILARLDDDAARNEITQNKRELEAVTGKPVRLFAYPNGKKDVDYDLRHVQMVREAGYEAAFTTAPGAATSRHDRFQIPRSRPWDPNPLLFAARMLRWLQGEAA